MTIPPITSSPLPMLPQGPQAPRPMFSALAISASGLSAQRVRMDVIAQNLANAETTRTPQGGPYQRHVVTLEPIEPTTTMTMTMTTPPGVAPVGGANAAAFGVAQVAGMPPLGMADASGGVQVASISVDKSEGSTFYDPANPDADKSGYVHMPNVNMTDELMDLMNSRRLYEANATVFQVARAMLHKSIDI